MILKEAYYLRMSFHNNDIIEVCSVLLADVFAIEVPRLVCSTRYIYLYGIMAFLAIDVQESLNASSKVLIYS